MKQFYFTGDKLTSAACEEVDAVFSEIDDHIEQAQSRYANFASTHEALGVALEEWTELQSAVCANALESVREEAIDLAAVLIRLAVQCRTSNDLKSRSVK